MIQLYLRVASRIKVTEKMEVDEQCKVCSQR